MPAEQKRNISEVAADVLNDLRIYLSVIDPVTYQAPLDILSGSTIGQHTRHIIEFYNCLLEQCCEADININYTNRRRDHTIESQPDIALQHVNEINDKLMDLDISRNCKLDCLEHGQEGLIVESTIGRELIYNIEHTIHHLAI